MQTAFIVLVAMVAPAARSEVLASLEVIKNAAATKLYGAPILCPPIVVHTWPPAR
jgi:hypothetical protein